MLSVRPVMPNLEAFFAGARPQLSRKSAHRSGIPTKAMSGVHVGPLGTGALGNDFEMQEPSAKRQRLDSGGLNSAATNQQARRCRPLLHERRDLISS